jgi:hypothetical protein
MTIIDMLHHACHAPLSPTARCVLYGKRPHWTGVFLPHDSVAYGGRPDKQRAILYHLCTRCRKRSDVVDAVEARILAGISAPWN